MVTGSAQYQDCEHYRYAHPGARVQKSSLQARCFQRVRYFSGLEQQTRQQTQYLQVLTVNNVRILQSYTGSDAHIRYQYLSPSHGPALELDATGRCVSSEVWYPFGGTASWARQNQAEVDSKTLRYCGKERDMTGLINYGFRLYVPWQMRWLNPDPAGTVDGLNVLRMVRNNPITLSDEDGRMPHAAARAALQAPANRHMQPESGQAIELNQLHASEDIVCLPGTSGTSAHQSRVVSPPAYSEQMPLTNPMELRSFPPPPYNAAKHEQEPIYTLPPPEYTKVPTNEMLYPAGCHIISSSSVEWHQALPPEYVGRNNTEQTSPRMNADGKYIADADLNTLARLPQDYAQMEANRGVILRPDCDEFRLEEYALRAAPPRSRHGLGGLAFLLATIFSFGVIGGVVSHIFNHTGNALQTIVAAAAGLIAGLAIGAGLLHFTRMRCSRRVYQAGRSWFQPHESYA